MEILTTIAYWFSRGGVVMYLLLAASLGAVTIIIERIRYYHGHMQHLNDFRARIAEDLETGRWLELESELCDDKILSNVTAAALAAARQGRSVELAMTRVAQVESAKLKQGLSMLACLVTLSPILGLMGTVIGMIQSFSVFNLQSGAPMAIAGGVGEALVATVTGLGVATIALLGHAYSGYRLDKMVTDMEVLGTELEARLTARETSLSGQRLAATVLRDAAGEALS